MQKTPKADFLSMKMRSNENAYTWQGLEMFEGHLRGILPDTMDEKEQERRMMEADKAREEAHFKFSGVRPRAIR